MTMKILQVVVYTAAIVLASAAPQEDNFGDIETMDVDKVLNDEATWTMIYNCLMDKAPCGDFQKLRAVFPQVVETKCKLCTPKQKEKLDQVVKIVAVKYPKQFQEISERYKPKNE